MCDFQYSNPFKLAIPVKFIKLRIVKVVMKTDTTKHLQSSISPEGNFKNKNKYLKPFYPLLLQ